MKSIIINAFLIIVFLYISFFKVCVSSNIIENDNNEPTSKVILINLTSNITSSNCIFTYFLTYKNSTDQEKGSFYIPKKEENTTINLSFSIKQSPLSFLALALYRVNDPTDIIREDDATPLSFLAKKPKIRTFSKINLKLVEKEYFDILLEPEYYLPPTYEELKW